MNSNLDKIKHIMAEANDEIDKQGQDATFQMLSRQPISDIVNLWIDSEDRRLAVSALLKGTNPKTITFRQYKAAFFRKHGWSPEDLAEYRRKPYL